MHFLVIAFDSDESDVAVRRMRAQADHDALNRQAVERGERVLGIDLLDRERWARGSAMVVDFPSLQAVDAWIAKEPFMTQGVWSRVEVYPCRIASWFAEFFEKSSPLGH